MTGGRSGMAYGIGTLNLNPVAVGIVNEEAIDAGNLVLDLPADLTALRARVIRRGVNVRDP